MQHVKANILSKQVAFFHFQKSIWIIVQWKNLQDNPYFHNVSLEKFRFKFTHKVLILSYISKFESREENKNNYLKKKPLRIRVFMVLRIRVALRLASLS